MSFLLDLIFPRHCYSCHRSGRYLCLDCQSKLLVKSIRKPNRLALFRYHGAIKNIIHDLKFEFVYDLVPEISLLISRTLQTKFPNLLKYWQDENFTLVPIPLHPHRHAWRGFNQSELIIKELSPLINLKSANLLVRPLDTLPQTKIKDKLTRHTNINHAFSLNSSMLNDKWLNKFILFDDVYTTGSTMRSAISCLPQGSEIWILTIA